MAVDLMAFFQPLTAVLTAFVLVVVAAKRVATIQTWVKQAIGVSDVEEKVDAIGILAIDEGDAINELNETVCREHDIPPRERPVKVKTGVAKGMFDERDDLAPGDFHRGGGQPDEV